MHGYQHVFCTHNSGVNPVNPRSEFAGLPLAEQRKKIDAGVVILREHGVDPKVFFAPAHTFDENTVKALLEETNVRIISDTPSNRPYTCWGMTFVPQQSGRVRELPFHTVTFCYHPNTMADLDYERLEVFFQKHAFSDFPISETKRGLSPADRLLMWAYFRRRK